mgnify:FL=1
MKSYEMLPTEENLIDFFVKDAIKRNKDIANFYKILQCQEQQSAIAIDGRWGSGKTFFVRQTKMVISAFNSYSNMEGNLRNKIISKLPQLNVDENTETSIISVYYDAWENDNDTEPILSLIYEITKQLSVDFSLSDKKIVNVADVIIESISGWNIKKIKDAFTSEDPFTKFKEQKNIEGKIKEFLTGLLGERANRLVIFIDELDRCNPRFAVQLLEQVKHYLIDERITFVFSVNLDQLQHTIKHHYGTEFDASRYLDRFFGLRIALPPADIDLFYDEIGFSSIHYVDTIMKRIIKMYNFELREITKFYLQVKTAIFKPIRNSKNYNFSFSEGAGRWIIIVYIVPLLIGLKIVDISRYDDFVNGKDVTPLIRLLNSDRDKRILKGMLGGNEDFDKDAEKKEIVSPEQVIKRLYEAIFVNTYEGEDSVTLGEYEFFKGSKIMAIRTASVLSDYADLI